MMRSDIAVIRRLRYSDTPGQHVTGITNVETNHITHSLNQSFTYQQINTLLITKSSFVSVHQILYHICHTG